MTTTLKLITFGGNTTITLAEARGLMEEAGLAVEVTKTPSSTFQMRGLIEGDFDVASTAFDNVLAWSGREGPEVVAVARAAEGVNLPIYVRPEISDWEDLRGKRLAVDAVDTAYGLVLRKVLEAHGLHLDKDYEFVPEGATQARFESMERGDTYAGVLNPPWNARGEAAGLKLLGDHREVAPNYPGGVYAVSKPWLAGHEDLLVAFLRAQAKAAAWARQDLAAAAEALAAKTGQDAATADRMVRRIPEALALDPEALRIPLDIRVSFGLTPPMGQDVGAFLEPGPLSRASA